MLNIFSMVLGELVLSIVMPSLIEGNSIFIPYGHIIIAYGCSGLLYFVISLLLGYLLAYMNRYTERGFLVVLIVAATIGLIANWLRIFILIMIGYGTQMQSPLMADHELFGWILFASLRLPAVYFARVVNAMVVKTVPHLYTGTSSWGRVGLVCGALALGPVLSIGLSMPPSVRTMENYWGAQMTSHGTNMPMPVTVPENNHSETVALSSAVRARLDQYQRTQIGRA